MSNRKNQIFSEAKRMLLSRTAKDSGIIFGGNLTNAAIGFISMIIVARTLGPENFGLFSVATSVMAVTVGLADIGLGTGLVRFASQALQEDEKRAMQMFKATFDIKSLISCSVFVLGWLLAPWLSMLLGSGDELILPLRLSFVGAGVLSMWSFVTAVFQSWQKFLNLAEINVAMNIVKLLMVLALARLALLTEISAITAYISASVLGLVIGYFLMPRSFMKEQRSSETRDAYRQLMGFSKWIMFSYSINSLISRIDIFILTNIKGLESVGLYSAAFQIAQVFPMLIGSLLTVLLPRVSRMSEMAEYRGFVKKSLTMSTLLIILLIPAYFLSGPAISFILPKFLVSVSIFKILFLAFLLNIVINPLGTILLTTGRPHLLTYINVLQLITAVIANLILIPRYGAYGAAYAFVIWTALGAILVALALVTTRRTWSGKRVSSVE